MSTMDNTLTLNVNDIEILDDEDLTEMIDAMTNELQRVPRVRPGRRLVPTRRYGETTAAGGRHRTWTPPR
jgi:hypothetical protein